MFLKARVDPEKKFKFENGPTKPLELRHFTGASVHTAKSRMNILCVLCVCVLCVCNWLFTVISSLLSSSSSSRHHRHILNFTFPHPLLGHFIHLQITHTKGQPPNQPPIFARIDDWVCLPCSSSEYGYLLGTQRGVTYFRRVSNGVCLFVVCVCVCVCVSERVCVCV